MRFITTRGGDETADLSAAVARGAPADGGAFLPERWPQFDSEEVAALAGRGLADIAAAVLGRFTEVGHDTQALEDIGREAGATLAHAAGAPLTELYPNVWLSDRGHGPTGSAADMEMQVAARMHARAGTALVAGFLGAADAAAAVEAFGARTGVRLAAFVSDHLDDDALAELASAAAPNVRSAAISGAAGDLQRLADMVGADDALLGETRAALLGAAGPLRPILGAVFYAAASVRLGGPGRPVDFVCPVADPDLAFAGWAAKLMGFPVGAIHLHGEADPLLALALDARGVPGHSAASAGLERIYFEAVERQGVETMRAIRALAQTGKLHLAPRPRATFAAVFAARETAESQGQSARLAVRAETGHGLDGETAVGAVLARDVAVNGRRPTVVFSSPRRPGADLGSERGAKPGTAIFRLAADADLLKAYIRRLSGVTRAA